MLHQLSSRLTVLCQPFDIITKQEPFSVFFTSCFYFSAYMGSRHNPSLGAARHSCSSENKHSGMPSLNIKFTLFTMNLKNLKLTWYHQDSMSYPPAKKRRKNQKKWDMSLKFYRVYKTIINQSMDKHIYHVISKWKCLPNCIDYAFRWRCIFSTINFSFI